MPLYEYVSSSDSECPECRDGFEILQRMKEPAIERCINCGSPVRRRISPPYIGSYGENNLKPDNLEKKGFTQYRKTAKGQYEKTAGRGPDFISDDGK